VTAFLIADIKVTNDKWIPEYAASVHDIVHKHGGKYLSRSGNVKTLEGGPSDTSLIAIMAFPPPSTRRPSLPIPHMRPTPRHARAVAKAGFSSSTTAMRRERFLT
jgi:uncharacterized protein (DUF1330 family)